MSYLPRLFGWNSPRSDDDNNLNPFLEVLQRPSNGSVPNAMTGANKDVDTDTAAAFAADSGMSLSPPASLPLNPPRNVVFPRFFQARPEHIADAVKYIQEQQRVHVTHLDSIINRTNSESNPAQLSSPLSPLSLLSTIAPAQLEDILGHLNAMEEPAYTLRQLTSLLMLLHDEPQWRESAAMVSRDAGVPLSDDTFQTVYNMLNAYLQQSKEATFVRDETHCRSHAVAAQSWIRHQEVFKPLHFTLPTKSSSTSQDEMDNDRAMAEALQDVEQGILNASSSTSSPALLAYLYNYIGLRNEQAIRNGYDHVTHQSFGQSLSSTTVAEVEQLHTLVSDRLVPYLKETMGTTPSVDEAILYSHYLSATSATTTSADSTNRTSPATQEAYQRRRHDSRTMLRLEHYVTLDGALQCAFTIMRDIMGLHIVAAAANADKSTGGVDTSDVWNEQVRLYHAYDELKSNEYVGSFYVDPCAREGKLARNVTIPILSRHCSTRRDNGNFVTTSTPVLVCTSLDMAVPAWDTDPIAVSWHQCEALFHELGHVAQFLLAQSSPVASCLTGPQNMPLDFSEFLPKFMEHCLFDRATVHALIVLSESNTPLSDDAMDAAFRMRSHDKALQWAQQAFYGSLELALWSGLDLKGDESLPQLQTRLARSIIPHDVPHNKDLTPLLDVVRENSTGRANVAWYRYLWCDALSASFMQEWQARASRASNDRADTDAFTKHLRADMRQWVLEPGAMIDTAAFRSEFGLTTVTPDALWQRYGL